ncbi:hypothetical protein [Actinomycetospora straminea]|uniref:Uncharacterized protein n=1 Tax=Actinomycetospora straminea TaxID=663607 RepID=A0ABP9E7B3_9PSEU|nr:hypothetical protein [Actinomycetospora straminea]MDD7932601.1 hypothetical protein [Actinomycetospora straminea]
MTTAERRAGPTITPEAAAAVPPPLRRLLRVQKRWSAPLAFAATGTVAVFTVVCWVEVVDRGRTPTWAGIGAIAGTLVTLCLGMLAVHLLRDVGHRFRALYADLGADRSLPSAPAAATDEVRLVWGGPERALVTRAGQPLGALRPDRPMTAPVLVSSLRHRAPLADGEGGRGADAVLHADGSRWRLTLANATGPAGTVHRNRGWGDEVYGELLEVDGRGALEVQAWVADADLRWYELSRPTVAALGAGEPLVWPQVPRHLSDSAVLWLVWRRVAGALLAEAHRQRDAREQSAHRVANSIG